MCLLFLNFSAWPCPAVAQQNLHTFLLDTVLNFNLISQDVIFGDNWVQYGYMFYGHYDGTYSFEFNGVVFDFPLAYFLTVFSGCNSIGF